MSLEPTVIKVRCNVKINYKRSEWKSKIITILDHSKEYKIGLNFFPFATQFWCLILIRVNNPSCWKIFHFPIFWPVAWKNSKKHFRCLTRMEMVLSPQRNCKQGWDLLDKTQQKQNFRIWSMRWIPMVTEVPCVKTVWSCSLWFASN